MRITKLNIFILLISAMLVISAPANSKTLNFAQLTDIHFSPKANASSSRDLTYSSRNLQFAIHSINKQNVNFTMFLGDNIDKSQPENLLAFLRAIQSLKTPYYMILGNHDAYKLSGIPKDEYIKLVNIYNPSQKSKKPYYYFYPNKDCIGIVVDGATPFAPSTHGAYTDEMLTWLDKVLTDNSDKIALIFQHFPLIDPVEKYSHSTLNPDNYFKLLKLHKNIVLISSGHYHADKVTIDENGIYHISVPSLLSTPNIYEIVQINYDKQKFKNPSNIKIDIQRIKI